jgi:hypothetical protein
MIDWMIHVLAALKSNPKTLFLAVQIMDKFFAKYPKSLNSEELHLTGVTSILIAQKYENIQFEGLKSFSTFICHGKFAVQEIAQRERDILIALKWRISEATISDFIER